MEILETNPFVHWCKSTWGKDTNVGVTLASQFQEGPFLHGSGC